MAAIPSPGQESEMQRALSLDGAPLLGSFLVGLSWLRDADRRRHTSSLAALPTADATQKNPPTENP